MRTVDRIFKIRFISNHDKDVINQPFKNFGYQADIPVAVVFQNDTKMH